MHSQRVHATGKSCCHYGFMLQASSSTSRTLWKAAGIAAPGIATSALLWARLPSSQLMMSACAPPSAGAQSVMAARMPACLTSGGTAACSAIPVPIALGTLGRHMQTHRTHKGTGPALGPPVGPRQPPRGSARKEDMLAGSAGRPRTRLAGGRTRIKAWPLMLTPRTECSRMKPRELNLYSDTPSSASTLCGRPGARRGAQRSVQRTATVCVSRGHMRSTSTCGRAQP